MLTPAAAAAPLHSQEGRSGAKVGLITKIAAVRMVATMMGKAMTKVG
jgi:hypothetical protein